MKTISATVFAALFACTQARFLDTTTAVATPATAYGVASYVNTLKCGQCIGAGYTYCIQKAEGTVFNGYPVTTTETCINTGATATQWSDSTYSCSNAFQDRVYSKYTCQFNTAACGTTPSVTFTNTNTTLNVQNVTVTSLAVGQTCFYTVKTACGGPAFLPDPVNLSKFEYEYIHYQDGNLNSSDPVSATGVANVNSNSTVKRQASPVAGIPRRDHFFRGELGGNQVMNQNQTVYSGNVTANGTVWGVSGRYDKAVGGRKVYGNPTQGALQLANLTNTSNADCTPRTLHLAVTAIVDASSTNVTFSTVSFYRPPTVTPDTTGASFISMTFAAVLGLVSLAFF